MNVYRTPLGQLGVTASTVFPRNSWKVLNFHAFRIKKSEFFFQVVLCQRFLSSSGVSPETLAKLLIVQSQVGISLFRRNKNRESTVIIILYFTAISPQLSRRGARPEHVAEVLRAAAAGDSVKKSFGGNTVYVGNSTKKKTHFRPTPRPRRSSGRQQGRRG